MRLIKSLMLILLLLSGCAAVRLFKADPAADYGFVPQAKWLKSMPDLRPFNASWVTKWNKTYSSLKIQNKQVYIAPIDISFVTASLQKEIKSESLRTARLEEAEMVASYFYERLKLGFEHAPQHSLQVASVPGPGVFELNLAIVQMHPTNAAINVIGTAVGFFVPGGGLIKTVAKGEVAIEGFIRDHETGKVLEQFKDREIDKAAPFTVKDFQQYAHIRASIDDWSDQLVEIMTKPVGSPVEDSLPFSLNPL